MDSPCALVSGGIHLPSVAYIVREAIELLTREHRQARMQAAGALFRIEAPVADWLEMERLGINDAFAFDSHFLVYRFGTGRQRAFRRFPQ